MRYKDIPKYTSIGSYNPSMSINYFIEWLNEHEKDMGLELNPDFQRGHVWTEQQQIKYIEHLLKDGRTATEFYFNQAGWMDDFKGEFVCVDGLQRITSIQKFMNNELKVFGCYLDDFEDKSYLMYSIRITININNLKTKKEVLQWYVEFNSGGTVHTDEEINRVKEMINKLS